MGGYNVGGYRVGPNVWTGGGVCVGPVPGVGVVCPFGGDTVCCGFGLSVGVGWGIGFCVTGGWHCTILQHGFLGSATKLQYDGLATLE